MYTYSQRQTRIFFLQNKLTVKHKPKIAEDDVNKRRTFPYLNKPRAVHNWSSVRGKFTYEIILLSRISRLLMLV